MALFLNFNSLYTEFSHSLQLQNPRSDRPHFLSCQRLGNRLPHRPPMEVRVQGGQNLCPEDPPGLGGCPHQTSPLLQYMMIQTQSSTATDLLGGGEVRRGHRGRRHERGHQSLMTRFTPFVRTWGLGAGLQLRRRKRKRRRGTGQPATRVSGLLNILCYINEGLPNHAFTSELCHNECSTLPQCIIAIFPISFQVLKHDHCINSCCACYSVMGCLKFPSIASFHFSQPLLCLVDNS